MREIDLYLCEKYLLQDKNLWRKACEIYEQIKDDQTVIEYIESFHRALIDDRNSNYGATILNSAVDYISLEHPGFAGMIQVVFLALLLPESLENYRIFGATEEIILDSFRDFAIWEHSYQNHHDGAYGIDELPWILHPFSTTVFRIGRLQYQPYYNPFMYYAYSHNTTGEVVVISNAGQSVCEDGYIARTNRRKNLLSFITTLSIGDGQITGYAVDTQKGIITKKRVSLTIDDYTPLLTPHSIVLNMHIPAGQRLAPAEVDRSLAEAKAFFEANHFPVKVVTCQSWLLDYKLCEYAPDNTNILDFMRRFYKYPFRSDSPSSGKFVFDWSFEWDDLPKFECKTSLQQNLKDYVLAGNDVFDTAGFLIL